MIRTSSIISTHCLIITVKTIYDYSSSFDLLLSFCAARLAIAVLSLLKVALTYKRSSFSHNVYFYFHENITFYVVLLFSQKLILMGLKGRYYDFIW